LHIKEASLDRFDLEVKERKTTGKGHARALRRQGLVPAVLYGPEIESIPLTVSLYDLEKIYQKSGSELFILNLTIKNGRTRNKTAMVKEMQLSPLDNAWLHVDFYEISMEKEITVRVPIELVGKSKGVELGGLLQVVRYDLEVSCLPGDIPNSIKIDVSELDVGDSVHVEEISVGDKIKLLYDTDFTVVTVVAPSAEEEEIAEEELEEGEELPEAETEAPAEEETTK
jgi:large subunit ribosomal protein L25